VDIVLHLTANPNDHVEGTARRADSTGTTNGLPFFGAIELLARLEQLADPEPDTDRPTRDP
jgi:hypothetical protein